MNLKHLKRTIVSALALFTHDQETDVFSATTESPEVSGGIADDGQARVDRLRADLAECESSSYMKGRRDGRSWAASRASLHQLRRIEQFRNWRVSQGEWREAFPPKSLHNPVPPALAARAAIGMPRYNQMAGHSDDIEFYSKTLGIPSAEFGDSGYFIGFFDGAFAVWSDLKHKI